MKSLSIAASVLRAFAVLCFVISASAAFAQPGKNSVQTVGKYSVELRIPAEGIYADEVVDIEFRLTDTSKNDPVLGAAGVIRAVSAAKVTMPAMPGMPSQTPKTHSEGVPGDYGIECFFPHGGAYRIALKITVPGEPKPIDAAFTVEVKDAEAKKNRKPSIKPYYAELLENPNAKAGEPTTLRIAIKDTKTKAVVKDFDIAHEQIFHLILVSKDLGWFAHEHPEHQADGTFTYTSTFPAGGDYKLFADVAPKGAGSQVLAVPLKVSGAKPTWNTTLTPTPLTATVDGITANMDTQDKILPIGRTTPIGFRLTDANNKPITNLETYLGAYGHLMIIHQDGQTFVHSHPQEDEAGVARSKSGTVVFDARFPKAGRYKAWGQFQRSGKVITLPFVFDVKGTQKL